MRQEDAAHCQEIVEWFSREAKAKYEKGTIEHGGFLPRKGGLLAEAEAECLDLPIYIRTIRVQLERVYELLQQGRHVEARHIIFTILRGTPDNVITKDIWGK